MIISASYKTDIPTFYGDWFANRLAAGFCKVVNPYNGRASRVSLKPSDVDAFVFWTKNIGPFVPHLEHIHERKYPFIIQHTINGYPRTLESAVTDSERSVEHVRRIAARWGQRVVVWRYDTILFSTLTDFEFHLKNFTRLARRLNGAVDEVVISFAHFYKKTQRNLAAAARALNFEWWDPSLEEKRALVQALANEAAEQGISLTVCSQPEYLAPGAAEARCVDAERIEYVRGTAVHAKLKGNRKGCGCYESRDIGEYDTCPHGCVYCYAVRTPDVAKDRFRAHDPHSEFLFAPSHLVKEAAQHAEYEQLPIFGGRI